MSKVKPRIPNMVTSNIIPYKAPVTPANGSIHFILETMLNFLSSIICKTKKVMAKPKTKP
jgi:hypothetical protein